MSTTREAWADDPSTEEMIDPTLAAAVGTSSLTFAQPGWPVDDNQMQTSAPLAAFADSLFRLDFTDLSQPSFDSYMPEPTDRASSEYPFAPALQDIPVIPSQRSKDPSSLVVPTKSLERISTLNLELRRHSDTVRQIAAPATWADSDSNSSVNTAMRDIESDEALQGAIVALVRGLQNLHELLVELIGLSPTPTEDPSFPTHASFQLRSNSALINLLSLTDGNDGIPQRTGPAATNSPPGSKTDSGGIKQEHRSMLDITTSLLFISCYINLVNLGHDVFAAIHAALTTPGRAKLQALSGFQVGGLPIERDFDLQAMLLVQFVVGLVDRIGASFARPIECGTEDGMPTYGTVVPPQLIDLALRHEVIDGQSCFSTPIEALRSQIRKLNKFGREIG